MYTFGPVPSRRLGQSLGVNNIPAKICTYACVYCQIGRTLKLQVKRERFYKPAVVAGEVSRRLDELRAQGETVDYITVVPDGEPTLDLGLGELLSRFRDFGTPVAIITNSSLIWDPDVRAALHQADWVSAKVDASTPEMWKKVDRPHGRLRFEDIQQGLLDFARYYDGQLVTETMLVGELNDAPEVVEGVARFLEKLRPAVAYLAVPTRPPAEPWVQRPSEESLNRAYQIFTDHGLHAELLAGFEGDAFASTGDARRDLLSITAVHPMRADQVAELLQKANADWSVVARLVEEGKLREVVYRGEKFYVRRF